MKKSLSIGFSLLLVVCSWGQIIKQKQVEGLRASFDSVHARVLYARNYGCVGDGTFVDSCAIASGTATLTSSSAHFASTDVGKKIAIGGAGAAGVQLITTITGFTNSTTITVGTNASTTVTSNSIKFGTDNTIPIQTMLNAAADTLGYGGIDCILDYSNKPYYAFDSLITVINGTNPNCQIYIPLVRAATKMVTIRLIASTPTNFSSEAVAAQVRNQQGVIIESLIQGTGTTPAVFGSPYYNSGVTGNKNYLEVYFYGIIVRTCTMNGNTDIVGTMSAINFSKILKFRYDNCKVDISSALVSSVEPTNATYGVIEPDELNQAVNGSDLFFAEGYNIGLSVSEHSNFGRLILVGNRYTIETRATLGHAISVFHMHSEANKYGIKLNGTGQLHILTLSEEHLSGGKWYDYTTSIAQVSGETHVQIEQVEATKSFVGVTDEFLTSGDPDFNIMDGAGQNNFTAKEFEYDEGLSEAEVYIERAVAAGGSLDSTAQAGLIAFQFTLDSAAITSKMKQILLYAGNTDASAVLDFMDNTDATLLNSPTVGTDGVTLNGTNQFINSNFNPSLQYSTAYSIGITSKLKTNSSSTWQASAGAYAENQVTGGQLPHWDFGHNYNGTTSFMCIGTESAVITLSNYDFSKVETVVRRGATDLEGYVDGVSIGTSSVSTVDVLINGILVLGARHRVLTAQTELYCGNTLQFWAAHEGLTDAEVAVFNTAINRLMVALGR